MGKLRICQNKETGYSLELGNKPFYFKQLQANVMFKGKEIGVILFPLKQPSIWESCTLMFWPTRIGSGPTQ
jgi:hypothetical protein